ncbi:SID1 transmembrane family member 2 [Neolamprologus brichardi]|uniref:SID1 transmembrane family member 2 n=1 Tax=Neolamprologus brichardi TaxID=32507 RepID=UPI0016438D6F|nr:SID1 transmembrane family member 2 [Neolamprologus brichardi]
MVLRSSWKSRHKNSCGPAPRWIRPGLAALLWLCAIRLACGIEVGETNIIQKDAEFDANYNDTVTSENQTIYAFNHTISRNKTEGVRVSVDVLSNKSESPTLFVVRQKQAVLSFQVPLILRGLYQRKYPYYDVGRTLCQPPTRAASETQYFFVDVSTLSSQGTNYQLRVSRVESFTLQTNKKFSFTASPSQPQLTVNMSSRAVEAYVMGMLFCLGIFFSFYLLTLLCVCLERARLNKRRNMFLNPADMSPAETASLLGKNSDGKTPASPNEYGSFADNGSTMSSEAITDSATSTDNNYGYMGQEPFKRRPILNHLHYLAIRIERSLESVARSRQESLSSIEEDDYDTLDDIHSDKNIVRTKVRENHFSCLRMIAGFICGDDTSFMYMIAGLCMLKLYQKRHPDINASAYTAYACLAAVIFFSVLGVVFGRDNTAFWIVFSVIHILATLLLSTQLYYMGRWRLNAGIMRRIVYVIYTDCIRQCSGPMYIDRMVLLVMGNLVNWSLAAYGLIQKPNDFASYLLAIAICNLLLYFAFYIIMKLRSGERIKCLALVCILFTAVVWGFALYFFFQGLSTWQKTPAESREHNRDCILLSFFDDHDIWHFLSSIAMFGSFLVL